MTATPTIHVFVAGEVATAANINLFGTNLVYLMAPPILQARQLVALSVANGASPGTAMTFTGEDVDPSGMHSTSTNTSRATAIYPGWYKAGGCVGWAANVTGQRGAIANVNGTPINASYGAYLDATNSGICITPLKDMFVFLNAGDFFEWFAVQTSGAALLTSISANNQSLLTMDWRSN